MSGLGGLASSSTPYQSGGVRRRGGNGDENGDVEGDVDEDDEDDENGSPSFAPGSPASSMPDFPPPPQVIAAAAAAPGGGRTPTLARGLAGSQPPYTWLREPPGTVGAAG